MDINRGKLNPGEYEILREGQEEIMKINFLGLSFPPSIEQSKMCMVNVIDKLLAVPSVNRVLLSSDRNYQYNSEQIQMLREIANIYLYLTKQKKILSLETLGFSVGYVTQFPSRFSEVQYVVTNLLKGDPVGAYVEIKRIIREQKIRIQKVKDDQMLREENAYLRVLLDIFELLDKTTLINKLRSFLDGHSIGDRDIYSQVLRATISPNFMLTRLMAEIPLNGEIIDSYSIDEYTHVNLLKMPDDIKVMYHLSPPEFNLNDEKVELLELARLVLSEHKPVAEEFVDPERMRQTFFNIGRDLIQELADRKGITISFEDTKHLANILVRYTVGFGLIEIILKDSKIQDVVVNGPIGESPIYVVHQDYDECTTNIIPSKNDGDSWATKFRMISGRPLDEANPVLDTELLIPAARARVAIISSPLNPVGLGYAFRRHREHPWTLPLFIKNKMITPLAAGLLSFLIDGGRTILFAGTRSSGKTSLLGASMIEIMRTSRIITVEDSVTGDGEILVKRAGKIEKTNIGKLIDSSIEKHGYWYSLSGHEVLGNDEDLEVLSMNKEGKIEFKKISKFIRHKTRKQVYRILTRTGKEIKVTGDHSLFGLGNNAKIEEIRASKLKEGDFIATPRKLNVFNKDKKYLNLLDYLDKLGKGYFVGEQIKELFSKYYYEIKQLGKEYGHNRSLRDLWRRKGFIPVKIVRDLDCLGYDVSCLKEAEYKISGNAGSLPVLIDLNKNFLMFVGLWIADGCYDTRSIILSVVEEENREIAYEISKKYKFNTKLHSDTFSLMLNSATLKEIMRNILDLKGNAYTKRVPEWIFNLSKEQVSYVLNGIFSGDGHVSEKEIVIPLSSLNLLKDIQTLLLKFGIILRIGKMREDKTYNSSISSWKFWKLFKEKIGILPKQKLGRLDTLHLKKSTHDNSDIIPLNKETKILIKEIYKEFNSQDYFKRKNNVGREKLNSMLIQVEDECELVNNLRNLAISDIFWDQIKKIEIINDFDDYVYDISVPENESFVCNNIIAHNTQELPVRSLRKLGYNIQPMKVRSALGTSGTELAAEEGIRTALRMGDSSLIVGEVRSREALALYEAMRVGALANVVAGTIHGGSPYAVFDRVVNDLGVPRTSFKATDIIVVSNPIKTPDSLHRERRIISITEVRKEWVDDPLREGGFIELMKYNPKTDELEPTDNLINGDSEVIKDIASNVKEWVGDWDAVWDNIELRAKMKRRLVDYAEETGDLNLLEAEFIIKANDVFHITSGEVLKKYGSLDSKKIYFRWNEWLKKEAKKRG